LEWKNAGFFQDNRRCLEKNPPPEGGGFKKESSASFGYEGSGKSG
jgi:hypothetical protein